MSVKKFSDITVPRSVAEAGKGIAANYEVVAVVPDRHVVYVVHIAVADGTAATGKANGGRIGLVHPGSAEKFAVVNEVI